MSFNSPALCALSLLFCAMYRLWQDCWIMALTVARDAATMQHSAMDSQKLAGRELTIDEAS